MANVALFTHKPNKNTIDWVRRQGGHWKIWHYSFHVEPGQLETMNLEVIKTVTKIQEKTDVASAGRILLVPPGLSVAVAPLCEALRGISGVRPEILVMVRRWNGEYEPLQDMPVVNPKDMYEHFRALREHGPVIEVGASDDPNHRLGHHALADVSLPRNPLR